MINIIFILMYCLPLLVLFPIKIKLKEFLIFLTILACLEFLINIPNFIFVIFIFTFLYYKSKNVFMSMFFSLLSFMMGVFGEVILANLLVLVYVNINNFINGLSFEFASYKNYDAMAIEKALENYRYMYYIIMALFPTLLSIPIAYYIKNKINIDDYKKPTPLLKLTLVFLVFLCSYYNISLISIQNDYDKHTVLSYLADMLPIGFIVLLSIFFYVLNITQRDYKIKTQKLMIEQLQQYTKSIEELYNSIKSFRHDFTNILSTMSIFISENKYNELEAYFNTKILPLQTKINNDIYKLSLLGNIKILELKGIIAYKAILAQEKNINFIIDITSEITNINLNIIDLTKIVGILLDNAIEESELCNNPYIKFCLLNNNESKSIIIANCLKDNLTNINNMFKLGFSTKGQNRGMGLHTIKTIIDENSNCLLETKIETKIENNEFIIKIDIYD